MANSIDDLRSAAATLGEIKDAILALDRAGEDFMNSDPSQETWFNAQGEYVPALQEIQDNAHDLWAQYEGIIDSLGLEVSTDWVAQLRSEPVLEGINS